MLIVGYFNTFDKVKYGIYETKKFRKPIYAFTPFYFTKINNIIIKKIKLPYLGKMKGKLIAQVELLEENDFPLARIHTLIGSYSKDNIYNLLLANSEHKYKDLKLNKKDIILKDYSSDFITIDPKGSVDLDDGFNINFPYLDIIIAAPIFYVDEKDIMNKYLEGVSSRYGKKVNHLWGDLVTNKCSLLENNSIECLVVRYNLETKEFDVKFEKGKSRKQYSYDEYNKENLCNNVLKKYFDYDDSCEMVSEIMVLCNRLLTRYCEENNLGMIYREFDYVENDLDVPKVFNYVRGEGAKYTKEKSEHKILGGRYGHFTSPLRRWVDMYNQMLIYNFVKRDVKKYDIDFGVLNYKFEKIKKFHSEYEMLNYNIDGEKMCEGVIYEVRDSGKLIVYLLDEKRFVKVNIFHPKLRYQKIVDFDSENRIWKIVDKISCEKMEFKYGEKINLMLKENSSYLLPSQKINGIIGVIGVIGIMDIL